MKIMKHATFDGDLYRLTLLRVWRPDMHLLVVCMLNPSTADAEVDDPTILALNEFAWHWGFGGILVVNLNAFRASKPEVMRAAADPVGPRNAETIDETLHYAAHTSGLALAAWGNGGDPDQVREFCRKAEAAGVRLVCLGTTQSGAPKHPMARGQHRIPRDQQPLPWSLAA